MRHTLAAKIRRYKQGHLKLVHTAAELEAAIRENARTKRKRIPVEHIESVKTPLLAKADTYSRRARKLVHA